MQSFPSFILTYISANYKEVTTFVSMQIETNLRLRSTQRPFHGPLKNITYIL